MENMTEETELLSAEDEEFNSQLSAFFEMFSPFCDWIETYESPRGIFICPLNSISVAIH
jgi:hypothetical protein